ncbi:DNA-binding response regulator, partial [Streptomyces sp. SID7982]|nr:DNA-binding response regulator [Streptomyces sp. SID7982]
DELLARLRASVRRAEPVGQEGGTEGIALVETAGFTVDLAAKKVHREGRDVRLTPTEWHLLEVLVRNAGRLVSQKQL